MIGLAWAVGAFAWLTVTPASATIDRSVIDHHLARPTPREAEACRVYADSLEPHLAAVEEAGQDSLGAEILQRLGLAKLRQGQSSSAIEYWRAGLDRARATGNDAIVAKLLQGLSSGYGSAGRYEEAIVLLHELIRNRRSSGDRRALAAGWNTLAACYNMMGRYPESFAMNDSSIALTRGTDAFATLGTAFARQASLLNTTGSFIDAMAVSDSALAVAETHDLAALLQRVMRDRSAILMGLRRPEDALAAARRSASVAEQLGDVRAIFYAQVRVMEILHALGRSREVIDHLNAAEGGVPTVVRARAAVQLDTMRASAYVGLGRHAEADSILERAIAEFRAKWEASENAADRIGYFQVAGEAFTTLASSALAQGRVEDAWRALEAGTGMTLRDHVTGRPDAVPLEKVQVLLETHRAALLHWSHASWSEMPGVLITPHAVIASPVQKDQIEDAVERVRRLVVGGASVEQLEGSLLDISEIFLIPNLQGLPPDTERLILVIPADLSDLPLEILPIRWNGLETTVGEAFAVSYVPSSSALVFLEGRDVGDDRMVVFADPTFDVPPERAGPFEIRGFDPVPLPEARREADEVATSEARVWVGEDATAAVFRSPSMSTAAVLHFATHVVVWPLDPERNTMFLAGVDGEIRASDIEARTFHADLVTLSGCRTASGHAYRGEGAVGLERSFFVAGARSVVASRWDVGDRATRAFMRSFYDALKSGVARDEALRTARMSLAAAGYPPRDYAAFRLSGVGYMPVVALVGEGRGIVGLVVGGIVAAAVAAAWMARRRRG